MGDEIKLILKNYLIFLTKKKEKRNYLILFFESDNEYIIVDGTQIIMCVFVNVGKSI